MIGTHASLLAFLVSFARSYGGASYESVRGLVQLTDGGYFIVGETNSFGAGSYDYMAIRLTSAGDPVWVKALGGTSDDRSYSVTLAPDGGCVIAGETGSYGAGSYDVLIVKLGPGGGFRWAKAFGGILRERGSCIRATRDTGYILAGWTASSGAGDADFLVMKLDSVGNREWARTFGGDTADYAHTAIQTQDGGFAVAGATRSFGAGDYDFLVLKLNASGTLSWAKAIGGVGTDDARILIQSTDGGYLIGGWTNSYGTGDYDLLLAKLNSSGNFQWAKAYGGTGLDWGVSGVGLADGGFLVAGVTHSFDPSGDLFLLRLDSGGNPSWLKVLKEPGDGETGATALITTTDGGFAVGGWMGNPWDYLVIKTNENGDYEEQDSNCMSARSMTTEAVIPNIASPTVGAGWLPLVGNPTPSQATPALTMRSLSCEVPVYENIKERAVGGSVVICSPFPSGLLFLSLEAMAIRIYGADGRLAYSGDLMKGGNRIRLEKGVYLWQAGPYRGRAVVR